MLKSMIKQRWWNKFSTIFIIISSSMLLDIPFEFLFESFHFDYYTILYTSSNFWKAFGYITIPIAPLDIPSTMKACLLEDSYLLTGDILCHPISYVTFSFTLFYLFSHMIHHTIAHTIDFFVMV